MKDEEILEKLHEFSEYLDVGNILTYLLRKLGWGCIQVLSFLVDGLEGITDSVLGVKSFFNSPDIQDFITKIQPFLYVLLAFSFLYIGYMLIIQKKVNREQIMINIFISMAVLLLLNTSMLKADKFTDQAIEAVDLNEKGTVSEKIIKSNLTDVAQFDLTKWKSPELKTPNKVPQKNIMMIDITEKIDDNFKISKDKELSKEGKKIVTNKADITPDGKEGLAELDNGWFDFFPELYYRWAWNFWTIAISLFVIGMTLLFTSIKLAKLCYELGFNAVLAQLVAPADIADGQKLKAVLKNILNTFLVTIMIFISMKVYLMGTVFISDKLEGIPYLIALIAFSIAVVDGPIMCERLFGIDAGLKSGWGALAGGFAMAKGLESGINMMGRTAKGGANLAKGIGGIGKGLGSGALQTAAGVGGLGKGLATQGNKEKQPALHEEMKKAGMAGEKGNTASKGQNAGNEQKAQQQGLSSTEKQEGGKNTEGNSSEGKGAGQGQGSSLQDEMQAAGVSTDSQGSTSSVEGGNTSLHDEMQASDQSERANEGTGFSVEGGNASLHDEMQASGQSESTSEGTGSSVEGGSASLHDEMQASDQSERASEGTGSSVESGSASLHDEMQASGYSGNTNGGSSSVGKASTPLHGEMQASGYSGNTNGGSSSVGKASTPLHGEMQASGHSGSTNGGSSSVGKASASLHDEMQASGYSGSTNGGSSSVGKASASLHDEMQASGHSGSTNGGSSSIGSVSTPVHEEIQTSGYGGSTSEGGSSVGNVSTPVHEEIQTSGYGGSTSEGSSSVGNVSTPVHEEIQTSGYGGSTSEGSSSIGSVSTPVHEEIQTSGYGGSTSEGGSSVENVSYPTPTREPSVSIPTGMDQAQAQVAATQEPRQEKQPIEKDTVPASTDDIPMPDQNRIETRNIAQVVKDNFKGGVGKVKERIDNSQTIHKTKRSYQIGRNTGRDLRNLGSKKRNKPEEK
ncbi:pLS20_p028 family conjugation system transmembrane protein (plasmid) [Priestia megaterium]|uniref:pLS20_p028 family conjugation system transmembrane protein n=1 Tax=Priestia megaterium TaxID=1404 RepID=UPI00351DE903